MNVHKDIEIRMTLAAAKARAEKAAGKSQQEITHDYLVEGIACFNEHVAGEVTLIDGQKLTIKEIEL